MNKPNLHQFMDNKGPEIFIYQLSGFTAFDVQLCAKIHMNLPMIQKAEPTFEVGPFGIPVSKC